MKTLLVHSFIFPLRFFFDTQPGPGVGVAAPLDKAKLSQRIDRFGKQGMAEAKKKLSIDDLLKSVVSLIS